jgi:peptidoglycan/LPS O-acetylase OafA/YrhL
MSVAIQQTAARSSVPAGQLPSLTSLRFFAAAMIVAFHAGTILGRGDISAYLPLSQGVSFFFVLSGFILAHAYPDFPNWHSVRRFYLARFARIWPLHIVTLLIWIAVIYAGSLATIEWNHGIDRLIASVGLVQSWVPIEVWATSYNGVSWSISVEMFFYLLFPLVILKFRKHWSVILLVQILVVAAFILLSSVASPTNAMSVDVTGLLYFSPAVRMLEFTFGLATRELLRAIPLSPSSIKRSQWTFLEFSALWVTFIFMQMTKSGGVTYDLGRDASFYISAAGSFPALALLIAIFSFGRGALSGLLSTKYLVFLGEISFALYLFHYTVVVYFHEHPWTMAYGWISYASVWAIALAGAALLHLLVERPLRGFILGFRSAS